MNAFSRSWQLTKLSFNVIKQDTEMLLFPLLGGIFSLLYSAALLFPTIITDFMHQSATSDAARGAFGMVQVAILFATYLGLSFIATFFNVCVVYTTKTRFEGGDATFMDSIKFAFSKIHLVLMWSLVSATVGLLLHALDAAADKAGAIGGLLLNIVRGLIGAIWSIVTLFVIPAMVYRDMGPFAAIKSSAQTLKQTWGESLVRHYGLGFAQLLFMLLGGALTIGMIVATASVHPYALMAAIAFGVVYMIGVILVFNVANAVFNTALYAWANSGVAPAGFDEQVLSGALGAKL